MKEIMYSREEAAKLAAQTIEAIKKLQVEYANSSYSFRAVAQQLENRKASLILEAYSDPQYKNEGARKAAATCFISMDVEYADIWNLHEEARLKLDLLTANIEELKRTFRVVSHFVRYH